MANTIGPGHGLGFSAEFDVIEIRSDGRRLEGLAVPYGVEATFGDLTETVVRGAFARSLASGRDILALVDHNVEKLLARTSNGTLVLEDRYEGLAFGIDLPPTQLAADVYALAERASLGGMSFGFKCRSGCDTWMGNTRQLVDVELLEISVVSSWPAYTSTTVEARCKGGACGCADTIKTTSDYDDRRAAEKLTALWAARRFLETV